MPASMANRTRGTRICQKMMESRPLAPGRVITSHAGLWVPIQGMMTSVAKASGSKKQRMNLRGEDGITRGLSGSGGMVRGQNYGAAILWMGLDGPCCVEELMEDLCCHEFLGRIIS